MTNTPHYLYSSLHNAPMFISPITLLLVPLLYFTKNHNINRFFDLIIYLFKLLIPFLCIYIALAILLSPLVYFKILYCIANNKYSN